MSWRDFWNGEHSIYVNDRHRALHNETIARDIAALIGADGAMALDHGCGDALAAPIVAARCQTLYLYDPAPNVRARLAAAYGRTPGVAILDDDAVQALPDATLDFIVCNSVLQYVGAAETGALFNLWRRLLKPGGRLVLADIIPPDNGAVADVRALLRFAWRGGFFLAACSGLVATFFSPYRALRTQVGLTTWSEGAMLAALQAHGFTARRAADNIGHNRARMTFIGTA